MNKMSDSNRSFASAANTVMFPSKEGTKELAGELLEKHKQILINGQFLPIRPLFTRNKRIIISNIQLFISHFELERILLADYNIKPVSNITFLRAGIDKQAYSHCLSFRRQMFVTPEDADSLPDSIQINYKGITNWVNLSGDSMKCFLCKEAGHQDQNCPKTDINSKEDKTQTHIPQTSSSLQINKPHSATESTKPTTLTTNDISKITTN